MGFAFTLVRSLLLILWALLSVIHFSWAQQGGARGILMIWNSKDLNCAVAHKELVEILKARRAQGHFVGYNVEQRIQVYDMAIPEHARALQILGVSSVQYPQIALTLLDPKGVPRKLVWRRDYPVANQGFVALEQELGIQSQPPPEPVPEVMPEPEPQPEPEPKPLPTDRLDAGNTLLPGKNLESSNGKYRLSCQPDGNLVIYQMEEQSVQALWASKTRGPILGLMLRTDGQLRLHNLDNEVLWETEKRGGSEATTEACYLQMQDDGNLVLYATEGGQLKVLWASGTFRQTRSP